MPSALNAKGCLDEYQTAGEASPSRLSRSKQYADYCDPIQKQLQNLKVLKTGRHDFLRSTPELTMDILVL